MEEGLSVRVPTSLGERDGVQSAVQLPVAGT
jgi:hypothetical protein